jgi:hypothetical protein
MVVIMHPFKSIILLEDCLDDLVTKEYFVKGIVTEEMMYKMAEGASLQYFPHFPRPFYRIKNDGFYTIQGIIGNDYFRVIFSPSNTHSHDKQIALKLGYNGTGSENG